MFTPPTPVEGYHIGYPQNKENEFLSTIKRNSPFDVQAWLATNERITDLNDQLTSVKDNVQTLFSAHEQSNSGKVKSSSLDVLAKFFAVTEAFDHVNKDDCTPSSLITHIQKLDDAPQLYVLCMHELNKIKIVKPSKTIAKMQKVIENAAYAEIPAYARLSALIQCFRPSHVGNLNDNDLLDSFQLIHTALQDRQDVLQSHEVNKLLEKLLIRTMSIKTKTEKWYSIVTLILDSMHDAEALDVVVHALTALHLYGVKIDRLKIAELAESSVYPDMQILKHFLKTIFTKRYLPTWSQLRQPTETLLQSIVFGQLYELNFSDEEKGKILQQFANYCKQFVFQKARYPLVVLEESQVTFHTKLPVFNLRPVIKHLRAIVDSINLRRDKLVFLEIVLDYLSKTSNSENEISFVEELQESLQDHLGELTKCGTRAGLNPTVFEAWLREQSSLNMLSAHDWMYNFITCKWQNPKTITAEFFEQLGFNKRASAALYEDVKSSDNTLPPLEIVREWIWLSTKSLSKKDKLLLASLEQDSCAKLTSLGKEKTIKAYYSMRNQCDVVSKVIFPVSGGKTYYYHATSVVNAIDIVANGINPAAGQRCQDFCRNSSYYLTRQLATALQWCDIHSQTWKTNGYGCAIIVYLIDNNTFTSSEHAANHLNLETCDDSVSKWNSIVSKARRDVAHNYEHKNSIEGPTCKNPLEANRKSFQPKQDKNKHQLALLGKSTLVALFDSSTQGIILIGKVPDDELSEEDEDDAEEDD